MVEIWAKVMYNRERKNKRKKLWSQAIGGYVKAKQQHTINANQALNKMLILKQDYNNKKEASKRNKTKQNK